MINESEFRLFFLSALVDIFQDNDFKPLSGASLKELMTNKKWLWKFVSTGRVRVPPDKLSEEIFKEVFGNILGIDFRDNEDEFIKDLKEEE